MCIDLVKGRTWLQSLNTTAKCGAILLCHIPLFRILHLPNPPPPPVLLYEEVKDTKPENHGIPHHTLARYGCQMDVLFPNTTSWG